MTKPIDSGVGIHIFGENSHTKTAIQAVITDSLQKAGFTNVTDVNGYGEPCATPSVPNALTALKKRFPQQFETGITVMSSLPDDERMAGSDPRTIVEAHGMMKSMVGHIMEKATKDHAEESSNLFHEARRLAYDAGHRDGNRIDSEAYLDADNKGYERGLRVGFATGVHSVMEDIGKVVENIMMPSFDMLATTIDGMKDKYGDIIDATDFEIDGNTFTEADLKEIAARVQNPRFMDDPHARAFSPPGARQKAFFPPGMFLAENGSPTKIANWNHDLNPSNDLFTQAAALLESNKDMQKKPPETIGELNTMLASVGGPPWKVVEAVTQDGVVLK